MSHVVRCFLMHHACAYVGMSQSALYRLTQGIIGEIWRLLCTHRHHIVHRYVASSVLQSARDVPGGGKSYLFKVALKAGFDMPISSMVGFVQRSTATSTHLGGDVSLPLYSLPPPSSTATKQTPNTSSRWLPMRWGRRRDSRLPRRS